MTILIIIALSMIAGMLIGSIASFCIGMKEINTLEKELNKFRQLYENIQNKKIN